MALVLDASVIAEFLVATALGERVGERMADHAGDLHVPHLSVIETVSVFRAWVHRGELDSGRAAGALDDLIDLPARRWPVESLLARVWELRDNVSAYDATYVALAEALGADLLTADERLARAVEVHGSCLVHSLSD